MMTKVDHKLCCSRTDCTKGGYCYPLASDSLKRYRKTKRKDTKDIKPDNSDFKFKILYFNLDFSCQLLNIFKNDEKIAIRFYCELTNKLLKP